MPFAIGASVNITWLGPGIITDIIGGPSGPLYNVLLNERTPHGLRSSMIVEDADLEPAPALPSFVVGQAVTIQGRAGTVTAVRGNMVTVLPEPDPIEDVGGVEKRHHFILPAWQLTAQNL